MLSVDSSGKPALDGLMQPTDAPLEARGSANSSAKTATSPLVASVTTKDLDDAHKSFAPTAERSPPSPATSFTNILPPSQRFSRDPSNLNYRDSQQSISGQTPQPYLPLRKKLTRSLKLGLSSSRRGRARAEANEQASDPSGSLADLAQRLRPQTSRSSHSSLSNKNGGDRPQSSYSTAPTELSLSPQSPSSIPAIPAIPASNKIHAVNAPPPASLVPRPRTSTSEYDASATSQGFAAPVESLPNGSSTPAVNGFPATKRPIPTQDTRDDTGRDSVRSAMTNGSSVPDLSSNARTSGLTDRSSAFDKEFRNLEWPKDQDDELTVEDCISMYAQGFTDDPVGEIPPIPEEPAVTPPPPDQTPASSTVETMVESPSRSETVDTSHTPSTSVDSQNPPSARHTYSSTSTSQSVSKTLSIPSQKPARDHYGFKKETQHVGLDQYDKWHTAYISYMERRRKKWIHLMNNLGLPSKNPQYFPAKSATVKRYIRKGIPPEWRGAAWFFYADGASYITKNPGLYQTLIAQAAEGHLSSSDREHIERDLHRTLPENKHFKPDIFSVESTTSGVPIQPDSVNDPPETEMILSLRRILQAFAVHHPKIGYCQSLNFLAAHLLLFMRAAYANENYEERAFVMLCILTEKHLPGTHGVILEGANVDIGVLMMFIQESMPGLWAKLDDKAEGSGASSPAIARKGTAGLPTVSLATTAWFMSCFVSTLPVETTCRVWDCLWYEGTKTIFRVALAIFKLGERDIRKSKDSMEMFQIVQNLPRTILDANTLIEIATKKRKVPGGDTVSSRIGPSVGGFGGLSAKTVEMRRNERRQLARREREGSMLGLGSIAPPPIPEEPTSAGGLTRSLSRSSSRSRLKRFKSMRKLA